MKSVDKLISRGKVGRPWPDKGAVPKYLLVLPRVNVTSIVASIVDGFESDLRTTDNKVRQLADK